MKPRLGALAVMIVVLMVPACATASPARSAVHHPSAGASAARTTAPRPAAARVPAQVDPTPVSLATALLTPLSLAVGDNGALWFSQNFLGQLELLPAGQSAQKVYQAGTDYEVGGVSYSQGRTWFTLSGRAETYGKLLVMKGQGKPKLVADLAKYEGAHNPDARARYGFRHLAPSCAAKLPNNSSVTYAGKVQTHPFATLRFGGRTIVADAAGNTLLSVKDNGRVSTLAVLPAVRTTMTKAYAKEQKLPRCTVGRRYYAEPVPTDVDAGPDGNLYVTTLPGGPAGEGGQARGAVWKVNPKNGHLKKVAGGLDTPTGLAVTASGDIYVCELFGNEIVRIPVGSHHAVPFYKVPLPGDIDATPNGLVATVNVLSGSSGKPGDPANGSVLRFG